MRSWTDEDKKEVTEGCSKLEAARADEWERKGSGSVGNGEENKSDWYTAGLNWRMLNLIALSSIKLPGRKEVRSS